MAFNEVKKIGLSSELGETMELTYLGYSRTENENQKFYFQTDPQE